MLLMVKELGCTNCPFAHSGEDSWECFLAYYDLVDGTVLGDIKPAMHKKPENCPLRGGGTFEISLEYED